jgi:hypothetical protein
MLSRSCHREEEWRRDFRRHDDEVDPGVLPGQSHFLNPFPSLEKDEIAPENHRGELRRDGA